MMERRLYGNQPANRQPLPESLACFDKALQIKRLGIPQAAQMIALCRQKFSK